MCQFIETIKFHNQVFYRLDYHQVRINKTFAQFFPQAKPIVLADLLQSNNFSEHKTYKCRLVYNASDLQLEYLPYKRKEINTLKVVESDIESLAYKIENRSKYNAAYALREQADDVLITVNGLLTDTSYANIALYDGENWFTPKSPLLYGTNRAQLLSQNKIIEKDIPVSELSNYLKICLFNAMIEFGELVLTVEIAKSIIF